MHDHVRGVASFCAERRVLAVMEGVWARLTVRLGFLSQENSIAELRKER